MNMLVSKSNIALLDQITAEQKEKLLIYERCLIKWQKALNLVAPSTLDDIWHRHFLDSAQLLSYVDPDASILCMGSGAGFPGAVLSILSCENVTLVERDQKKCSFLRTVSRETGAGFDVYEGDVRSYTETPEIVVSRALASIDLLLKLSSCFNTAKTQYFFLKGIQCEREIQDAKQNWHMTTSYYKSITDNRGCVASITNVSPL